MNRAEFVWGDTQDINETFIAYYLWLEERSNIFFILDNLLNRKNENPVKLAKRIDKIYLQELICILSKEQNISINNICGWDDKWNYSECPIQQISQKMSSFI